MTLLAAAIATAPATSAAQERTPSVREALGIDRLQLSSVGAWGAQVWPTDIEPTEAVGLQADYGEVFPGWRVVVGVSYWKSRFDEGVVQRFADSLAAVVNDPTGDATVEVGRVSVSVLAATAEARWSPLRGRHRWRPYLGAGIGAYAQNAEGRPVSGTFIESALDNIAAGFAASAGADVRLLPNLSLGMQARYDLLSGTRYASLRAGASYVFRARTGG
ncbi:MAG TPA: outer membrane beta-barrel protein [Gemmatimonadales bacterium]